MSELGLTMLPELRYIYGIQAEDDKSLQRLEEEAKTILQHSAEIDKATKIGERFVIFYANNILNAIEVARKVNGCVSIG